MRNFTSAECRLIREFAETYPYSENQVKEMLERESHSKTVESYIELLKKNLKAERLAKNVSKSV